MTKTEEFPVVQEDSVHQNPVKHRFELSITQLVASALAAVTGFFVAAKLGVNGTVLGAGLASATTVTAGAIYSDSIHRTRARVLPAAIRSKPETSKVAEPAPLALGWRKLGIAFIGLFVLLLGVIAGIQIALGRPASSVLSNHHPASVTVTPTTTVVVVPTTVTVTRSPSTPVTVTETATPSSTPTPSASATPTPTPSESSTAPSSTPTPSGTTTP